MRTGTLQFTQVSSATFGAEQPIYWREASTNLNSPAYFFAKVVADIPICFCSALSATAGYLTGFLSPMSFGPLFAGFLQYTMFGFLSGYFLSFILPYSAVSLAGVVVNLAYLASLISTLQGWAVFWALLYGGTTQVRLHGCPFAILFTANHVHITANVGQSGFTSHLVAVTQPLGQ